MGVVVAKLFLVDLSMREDVDLAAGGGPQRPWMLARDGGGRGAGAQETLLGLLGDGAHSLHEAVEHLLAVVGQLAQRLPHGERLVLNDHLAIGHRPAGAAQLAWIDAATDLVVRGDADALVTGPVSKDVIASSGAKGSKGFLGHTEHLGDVRP